MRYRMSLGPLLGPIIGIPLIYILSQMGWFFVVIAWLCGIALVSGILAGLIKGAGKRQKTDSRPPLTRKIRPVTAGRPNLQNRDKITANGPAGIQVSSAGPSRVDKRFALIDGDGQKRFAQIIKGTFQIGKGRESCPTDLAVFACSILKQGSSGRFARADGSKFGVLGYGGSGRREVIGYSLDPTIADAIGVKPEGHL